MKKVFDFSIFLTKKFLSSQAFYFTLTFRADRECSGNHKKINSNHKKKSNQFWQGRRDTQHDDIQDNEIQHSYGKKHYIN